MARPGTKIHELIRPLSWLLGKWRGENGIGKDFRYIEELEYFHVGKPAIQFASSTWNAITKVPLHSEVGFIRPKPDSNKLAFIAALHFGVVEIEEGTFKDTEFKLVSNNVGSTTFVRDPIVTKVERHFKRVGDTLEIVISMETVNTPMTEHARNTLTKM